MMDKRKFDDIASAQIRVNQGNMPQDAKQLCCLYKVHMFIAQ